MLGRAGHFTAVCTLERWEGRGNNVDVEFGERELQAVMTADS